MNKTVPYRKAMYAGSGLKTANLKYEVKTVVKGTTDPNENRYRRSLAVDTLILFTDFGYRISFVMTSAMMLISLFMIVYTLVVYLIGNPIEGWTTTALFLSFGFFGLFAILTVIVKYLQIIVDMVFKRKHYSFESIEKLTK
jgi:dolichol-phosphate mannosyltransferase